jgi:ABC-2 type transport system permease protein
MVAVFRALWQREITKFVRDRSRLIGALVQPLGFWLVLGLGFYGTFHMPGVEGLGYLEYLYPGIIALILLFTAIFSTISVVQERQEGFLQAALVAPVPRSVIVVGLVSGGTTLAVGQAALFLLLIPVAGYSPTITGIGIVILSTFLMALAFTALGFTIAWRLDTTRGFHAVMNLFLLPLWFLSGAVFPVDSLPASVRWVMYLDPVTYGVAAIRMGLYWPEAAHGVVFPLVSALMASLLFAVAMIALAVWTVRRPLFGP